MYSYYYVGKCVSMDMVGNVPTLGCKEMCSYCYVRKCVIRIYCYVGECVLMTM